MRLCGTCGFALDIYATYCARCLSQFLPEAHDPHANPNFERLVPRDLPQPADVCMCGRSRGSGVHADGAECGHAFNAYNSIYLIGSLRNPRVPEAAKMMREAGWDVFDDWYAAGEHADDAWRDYERARGHDVVDALKGLAAKHVDEFDQFHLNRCQHAVLLMKAGSSAHLELGQFIGAGKPSYIILDGDPERYDVMYRRATGVFRTVEEFIKEVKP